MTPRDYIVAGVIGLICGLVLWAFVMSVWGCLWIALGAGPVRFWAWPLWLSLLVWLGVSLFLVMVAMAAEGV